MKLVPNEALHKLSRENYKTMREMFLDEFPLLLERHADPGLGWWHDSRFSRFSDLRPRFPLPSSEARFTKGTQYAHSAQVSYALRFVGKSAFPDTPISTLLLVGTKA
jgi:hypothetical protein